MANYTQTPEELKSHLAEQLAFLEASAASYDSGFEGEAKRLATTIRVLVHDTASSNSLLAQLGIKASIQFHNTARPFDPANQAPHQGLVILRMGIPAQSAASLTLGGKQPVTPKKGSGSNATLTYVPLVNAPGSGPTPVDVGFDDWWSQVVIKDATGQTYTRQELVLAMANKEGGAHVDPQLDAQYAALTRFNAQGWQVKTGGLSLPPDNSIVAARVRQVAYELLISIKRVPL